MVDAHDLSAVLSEFARTLTTDFPIQGILDHLVRRVVEVLPVCGAGVSLIDTGPSPHQVAASDERSLRFERLQGRWGEGPCVTAWRTGGAVSVPDLREEHGFPRFSEAARVAGMGAVFAFPLRHGPGRLGALDVYLDRPGVLLRRDLAAAQTLADVAAAYVLNARARHEAREISDRYRDRALHDALTGLPNRALLQQRLQHAAQRAHRSHAPAAVLFVDLDRFKQVNDRHGHATGDDLLVAVASRLSGEVRPGDTLARVSGDEFVVLCEDLAHLEDAVHLATRIRSVVGRPFRLPRGRVRITASVGIAYAGPGERISDQLVGDADLAMYRAKRRGGSAHALAEPVGARALGAASAGQVAAVPATGQLYRPVVSTRDGACTELRMERTAVAGSRRRERAADGAGRWWPALEAGLTERAAWPLGRAGGPVGLSVTVPVRRLASAGFPRRLGELLVATATDPAHLVLELPAPTAAEAAGGVAEVLDELRALGVGSVLAGIGSGTWSFEALRLLPADSLELDPCLVAGIGRSPRGEALVTAVGGLVHALGRRLAAAGVATRQQHEVLAAAGCERAHGPLHGSAVPASQVSALLRGRSSRNSAPGPLGAGVAAR